MYFIDFLHKWLKNYKPRENRNNNGKEIEETTLDGYFDTVNTMVGNFREYDIGSLRMYSLTLEELQNYFDCLANYYARGTIKRIYTIINQALDYAETYGYIEKNFMNLVTVPAESQCKIKKREKRALSLADIEKLNKEAFRLNTKEEQYGGKIGTRVYGNNGLICLMLLHTGMRISELAGVRWKNICYDEHAGWYIDVDQQLVDVVINKELLVENQNGDTVKKEKKLKKLKSEYSVRTIPLTEVAQQIIQIFSDMNPDHQDDDFVFTSTAGTPLCKSAVRKTIKKMAVRAGCEITDPTPHEMRHTYGTVMVRMTRDPKLVSEMMGHSDTKMLDKVYYHIVEEQKVEAMKKLSDGLKQAINSV